MTERTQLVEKKGPRVQWTVADLLQDHKEAFIAYHVIGVSYDIFTPVGALLGGAYKLIFQPQQKFLSLVGTCGLISGFGGMAIGGALLYQLTQKGEDASPPWNEEGIDERYQLLSQNFMTRVLDLSTWIGLAASAALLPVSSTGRGLLGALQTLTLGATVGSLAGITCVTATKTMEESNKKEASE